MIENEFWVEPIEVDGSVATVRASFDIFSVLVRVERQDGMSISEAEAETAYHAVLDRVPVRARAPRQHDSL